MLNNNEFISGDVTVEVNAKSAFDAAQIVRSIPGISLQDSEPQPVPKFDDANPAYLVLAFAQRVSRTPPQGVKFHQKLQSNGGGCLCGGKDCR